MVLVTSEFCPKHCTCIWLVVMATKRLNFLEKIFKNLLFRCHKGDEAETFSININYISLYKKCVFHYHCSCFFGYGNLKFPLAYNRKRESRFFFLSHGRHLDRSLTEMFLQ